MQQMDMFHTSREDFLYNEIDKVRSSMDRRTRAMFSLITELEDRLYKMQEKEQKRDENAV